MDNTSFSLRHNAKRAAERAIDAGTAPSIDYGIHARQDGRFEIAWRTGEPTEDIPETEADQAEREDEVDTAAAAAALAEIKEHPERLISGTALEERLAAMNEEPSAESDRKPSRSAELDAAATQGTMPAKPIVTSKANQHYQKRFDHLADCAAAGDWDAVRAYEVKGINSYAKMVRQYRDRLLAAHAAQSTEEVG